VKLIECLMSVQTPKALLCIGLRSVRFNTSSKCDGMVKITSISYSYLYPVGVGLTSDVFFFGDNPSLAASHAILHAGHLASVTEGNIIFMLHLPERLDIAQINAEVLGRSDIQLQSCMMEIRSLLTTLSKLLINHLFRTRSTYHIQDSIGLQHLHITGKQLKHRKL
jgi:hypothetical protein